MYRLIIRFLLGFALGFAIGQSCNASTLTDYTELVYKVSKKYDVDPKLVLAIIEVESNGDRFAKGSSGEIGLMQVRPEYSHGVTFEPSNNVEHGVRLLSILRAQCKFKKGMQWVVCYNKGPTPLDRDATKTRYYNKVMGAYYANQR